MTEHLLQKLEERLLKLDEKMMVLLTEIEDSHNEIQRLTHENSVLKIERENREKHLAEKLTHLISSLDNLTTADDIIANTAVPAMKPVLVQG